MGAEWYSSHVFLGIKFPRNKARALWKALRDEKGKILRGSSKEFPVTIKYFERKRHSRTECEDEEKTLARCTGFLGIVRESATIEELSNFRQSLVEYLEANKAILAQFKITDLNPRVLAGICNSLFELVSDDKNFKRARTGKHFYDEDEDEFVMHNEPEPMSPCSESSD